jgi:hypothetical protein
MGRPRHVSSICKYHRFSDCVDEGGVLGSQISGLYPRGIRVSFTLLTGPLSFWSTGEGADTQPIQTMYSAAAGTAYVTLDNVKLTHREHHQSRKQWYLYHLLVRVDACAILEAPFHISQPQKR